MAELSSYARYQEETVFTATPGELIVMLFSAAVKNIRLAIDAVNEKRIEDAHNAIVKTQEIYFALCGALDESIPIAQGTKKLYQYIIGGLTEANVKKDADILRELLKLSGELRDTWQEAEKHSRIAANRQARGVV